MHHVLDVEVDDWSAEAERVHLNRILNYPVKNATMPREDGSRVFEVSNSLEERLNQVAKNRGD